MLARTILIIIVAFPAYSNTFLVFFDFDDLPNISYFFSKRSFSVIYHAACYSSFEFVSFFTTEKIILKRE